MRIIRLLQFCLPFLALTLVSLSSNVKTDGFSVLAAEKVTVYFIDVGQGDSILIDTSGSDVLVDGGPQAAGPTVLGYLNTLNVTRIHMMFATHMHEDHIGGLIAVLRSSIQVDEVLTNGEAENTSSYASFIALAQNHTLKTANRGQTYVLTQSANLTILNPTQPLQFDDQNENSIVIKLQTVETTFLLEGDAGANAEQSMLEAGLDLKSDVLKVGHHGSRYATTDQFLDSVSPSYAIISAGKDNVYGHPNQETIQRLLAHGVTIYCTIQSGTIMASTDGTSITFQDSPQPIPEFPETLMTSMLLLMAVLTVMTCRRHRTE